MSDALVAQLRALGSYLDTNIELPERLGDPGTFLYTAATRIEHLQETVRQLAALRGGTHRTPAQERELMDRIAAALRVVARARVVRDDADPMGGVRRGVVRFDESGDSSNDATIGRGLHDTLLMANANDMQALHDSLIAYDALLQSFDAQGKPK